VTSKHSHKLVIILRQLKFGDAFSESNSFSSLLTSDEAFKEFGPRESVIKKAM